MKAVLTSIRPRHTVNIIYFRKHWEIRRDRPKLDTPFKDYIYCTKKIAFRQKWLDGTTQEYMFKGCGKVVGEFICDEIVEILPCAEYYSFGYDVDDDMLKDICLTREELMNYGKGRKLFAWHISDLKIYDKPKELSEFRCPCKEWFDDTGRCGNCEYYYCINNESYREEGCGCEGMKPITRPPQSWMFIEEVK